MSYRRFTPFSDFDLPAPSTPKSHISTHSLPEPPAYYEPAPTPVYEPPAYEPTVSTEAPSFCETVAHAPMPDPLDEMPAPLALMTNEPANDTDGLDEVIEQLSVQALRLARADENLEIVKARLAQLSEHLSERHETPMRIGPLLERLDEIEAGQKRAAAQQWFTFAVATLALMASAITAFSVLNAPPPPAPVVAATAVNAPTPPPAAVAQPTPQPVAPTIATPPTGSPTGSTLLPRLAGPSPSGEEPARGHRSRR